MILTLFSPFLAWWPLSGRDRKDELDTNGRPEPYLLAGAVAAIPAVVLRLGGTQPLLTVNDLITHAYFTSLFDDGLAGTLLPLAAMLVLSHSKGRPRESRSGTSRASLVILGYVLVDGFVIQRIGHGGVSLFAAMLRSIPKLAMAPIWGYLIADGHDGTLRRRGMIAFAVFGVLLNGAAAFFLAMDVPEGAVIPSLVAFPLAIGFRYGSVPESDRGVANRDGGIHEMNLPVSRVDSSDAPRRRSARRVYKLMRDGRYSEARLAAEHHLMRFNDLSLYAWQALLRWMGGDRAYKLIFLRRYKALGEVDRNRIKRHMDEFVTSKAPEVLGWIASLEQSEGPIAV